MTDKTNPARASEILSAGQESVWDYPRPPRLEPCTRHLRVIHAGIVVAETRPGTREGMRILETSHPPVYYIPPEHCRLDLLRPSRRSGSFCEFKGIASYWDLVLDGHPPLREAAWSYSSPSKTYAGLKDYLAFYANKVDQCWVDDELVTPQPGDFYGGWITSSIKGPFKGPPGTMGW